MENETRFGVLVWLADQASDDGARAVCSLYVGSTDARLDDAIDIDDLDTEVEAEEQVGTISGAISIAPS